MTIRQTRELSKKRPINLLRLGNCYKVEQTLRNELTFSQAGHKIQRDEGELVARFYSLGDQWNQTRDQNKIVSFKFYGQRSKRYMIIGIERDEYHNDFDLNSVVARVGFTIYLKEVR